MARCSPGFFPCSYTLIGPYVTINNTSITMRTKCRIHDSDTQTECQEL